MRFRRQALRYLEAPEQLDQVVRLASPRRWLLGIALSSVVSAAAIWASVGRIAQTWDAPGVLVHADGISQLDATQSGVVERIWTSAGAVVKAGAPLYSVRAGDGALTTVTAPWPGYVVHLLVAPGNYVAPGTHIGTLEPVTGSGDQLVAAIFVPEASVPMLKVGEPVTVDVPAAPAAAFGHLTGSVAAIGAAPETAGSLAQFLGNSVSSATFLANGPVIRVIVRLATTSAASTANGSVAALRWSKAVPPYQPPAISSVNASFTISDNHPISWLVSQ
jgi:multidrug efflux pump subunit AcrA (membrane-fusion protein)